MSFTSFICTLAAIGLVYLTSRYRRNARVIAIEFALSFIAAGIIIDLEGYKFTGSHWLFGIRALILYWAMRETLKLKPGHMMIYIVMLLGMFLNIGAYFEYARKDYGIFDYYYTPAALAVMALQLLYLIGIGYVGQYMGRVRISFVRWWRACFMLSERRKIIRRT